VQIERTSLAWSRTAFAFAVVGAFALRLGIEATSALACVTGGLLMLGSLGTSAYGSWAYGRRTADIRGGRPILRTSAPRATSALICLASVALLVVLL
jgi:uncharacterized membrane protein YidH (DUF202 family)